MLDNCSLFQICFCEGEGGCGGGGEAMNRLNVALLQSQRMNQCRR